MDKEYGVIKCFKELHYNDDKPENQNIKKKTKKEEVEHIDELNFDTLSSYVRKAYKDQRETGKDRRKGIGMAKGKQDDKVFGKTKKNKYGYSEEVEIGEAKKMVKVKLKDPSKIKVKVTDIGAGGKEYVRKNEMDEGTSYGIYKGTGKPSGAMAAYLKNKKKKDKEKKKEQRNEKSRKN